MKKTISLTLFLCLLVSSAACAQKAEVLGKILLKSNRDYDKPGMYLYENGEMRHLTNQWIDGTWFPDGKKILFAQGNPEYAVYDLETRQIVNRKAPVGILHPKILKKDGKIWFVLAERLKKPDGSEMGLGVYNIATYDEQLEIVKKVTKYEDLGHIAFFDIAANAKYLACTWVDDQAREEELFSTMDGYILDLRTLEQYRFEERVNTLRWHPVKNKLYYVSSVKFGQWVKGWSGLFSYDPETKQKELIADPFGAGEIEFSPDGSKILYSNWCPAGICLYTFDLETKENRILLDPPKGKKVNDHHAQWIA